MLEHRYETPLKNTFPVLPKLSRCILSSTRTKIHFPTEKIRPNQANHQLFRFLSFWCMPPKSPQIMAHNGLKSSIILSSQSKWFSIIFIWIKAKSYLEDFSNFHKIQIENLSEYPAENPVEHHEEHLHKLSQNFPKSSRKWFLTLGITQQNRDMNKINQKIFCQKYNTKVH